MANTPKNHASSGPIPSVLGQLKKKKNTLLRYNDLIALRYFSFFCKCSQDIISAKNALIGLDR